MHTMRRLINLAILFGLCHMATAIPGIVDSLELRRAREITKTTSLNSIASSPEKSEKQLSEFQPMKLTHEDVVTGSNSVYGSQFPSVGGGIIFAITGQSGSMAPHMSAAGAQPVLLQYLSPEGMSRHTGLQYIQLLRPLMMVPAPQFLPARTMMPSTTVPIETATTTSADVKPQAMNPYGSWKPVNSVVGAQSAPFLQFVQSHPRPLIMPNTAHASNGGIGLNMNEYIPAASSRSATSVISPQVSNISMVGFKPANRPMMAQRA